MDSRYGPGENEIVAFYEKLYSEDIGYRPLLDGMPFDGLSVADEIFFLQKGLSRLRKFKV